MHSFLVRLFGIFLVSLFAFKAHSQPGGTTLDDIRAHQFSQLDTDGDGYISKSEFSDWYLQRLDSHFIRLDLDSNGQLSNDEFLSRSARGGPKGEKGYEQPVRKQVK